MSTSTVPMSIRIESDARERLKVIALHQKRSAHSLAAEAINNLILEKEKELAWNQSCINSYNDYKTTGLHVNQQDVEKWMDSWGTDQELPQPPCHR